MFLHILFCIAIINVHVTDAKAGGVVFQISEDGLNKVIKYIMDIPLSRFINEYEFKNTSQVIKNGLSVDINNLKIISLSGHHGVFKIGVNNLLTLEFGFKSLKIEALLNLNLEGEEGKYQQVDTAIEFTDGIISMELKLEHASGHTQSYFSMESCIANIGKAIPNDGELALLIKLALSGDTIDEMIFSDVCPMLEQIINDNLGELLDIAGNFKGSVGGTPMETTVFIKTIGIENKSVYLTGYVVITTDGNTAVKPTEELSIPFSNSGREVYLLFNEAVLDQILNLKFEKTDIFLQNIDTENLGVWRFLPVNPSLTLQISPSAMIFNLVSNVTIQSDSGFDTVDVLTATLNGEFPMHVQYNDSLLKGNILENSFTMKFETQAASQKWMDYPSKDKCAILVDYYEKIKTVIHTYQWDYIIPENRDFGIESLDLVLQQSFFKIGSNVRLGKVQGRHSMALKSLDDPTGVGKLALYEFGKLTDVCYVYHPIIDKAATTVSSMILTITLLFSCILTYLLH